MPTAAINTPAAKTTINPISGVFGSGKIELIFKDGNFTAPITGKYRIRVWGAGGRFNQNAGGAGGGFALKEIELNEGDTVPVTVATSEAGNTSSFGSYVSATSGQTNYGSSHPSGGIGVGGDINYEGGRGQYDTQMSAWKSGGGAASLFGDGGDAVQNSSSIQRSGSGSGSGQMFNDGYPYNGGHEMSFSECLKHGLDFIGAGSGGGKNMQAASGGGAAGDGNGCNAGFPAGGGAPYGILGADGLVTVEY